MTIEEKMTQIATEAIAIDASRKDAQIALERLIELMEIDGQHVDPLCRLYGYLCQTPKPRKLRSAWDWLLLANDPKHFRIQARAIEVNKGIAYASDGKRLHAAPTDLKDGNYDRQWNRVHIRKPVSIKDASEIGATQLVEKSREVELDAGHTIDCFEFREVRGESVITVQRQFWRDAVALEGEPDVILADEKFTALRLEWKETRRFAIIMGVKGNYARSWP